jgi:hypothetical protein
MNWKTKINRIDERYLELEHIHGLNFEIRVWHLLSLHIQVQKVALHYYTRKFASENTVVITICTNTKVHFRWIWIFSVVY